MNHSNKTTRRGATNRTRRPLLCAALLACLFASSCAKYAPQPPPPVQRKMLEIVLTTKENLASDVNYYIAFDTSNSEDTDGPHAILSGAEVAKNWNYYILVKDAAFTERFIGVTADVDADPTPLNQTERYYSAFTSGKLIVVRIYLDKLLSDDRKIWFNFITSRDKLTTDPVLTTALDYLTNPSFSINTAAEVNVSNIVYPSISNHAAPAGSESADIIAWSVRIYKI